MATLLFIPLLLLQSSFNAATNFIHSRASYYPNSDQEGTSDGACGYRVFGATLNGGDVSAASNLYNGGVGCGACYQVRCTDKNYCSDTGVTAVITDSGSGDNTDFILSQHAFLKLGQTADAAASLMALGVVDVEYQRVSCNYPDKNIAFKIDESSNFPYYLAFLIEYQQGVNDVTVIQLCETVNLTCKLVERSYGAVWAVVSPPIGPLLVRMLLSSRGGGNETWIVPTIDIPKNWIPGTVYDSGVQLQ